MGQEPTGSPLEGCSQEELRRRVLESFNGTIPVQPLPLYYRVAVVLVAFVMVLLPLCYLGIVFFTAKAVYYCWTEWPGIVSFGPVLVGCILLLFMIKPFFVRRSNEHRPRILFPKAEPVLFAFVTKICQAVQAPVPSEIHITCEVNASAGFNRGLFSFLRKDMVLTIGLPLAGGLNVREFSGVLAHEFGHFAQRTGIRLTYLIRRINGWFESVVRQRDVWDEWLYHWAHRLPLGLGLVLQLARLLVAVVRGILWALMMVAHILSCYLSRQMEFDADRYATLMSGSLAFADTTRRVMVLSLASEMAYNHLQYHYEEGRLADDIPQYVMGSNELIPKEVLEKATRQSNEAATGWFDTHPATRERNSHARLLNQPGLFVPPPKKILRPPASTKPQKPALPGRPKADPFAFDALESLKLRARATPQGAAPGAPQNAPASGATVALPARKASRAGTDPFAFTAPAHSGAPSARTQGGGSQTLLAPAGAAVPAAREGGRESEEPEGASGPYLPQLPASVLFRDFKAICKTVSHDFYQAVLGKRFQHKLLCPVERLLKEQVKEQKSEKALGRYFQGQLSFLRPLPLAPNCFDTEMTLEMALAVIRECREKILQDAKRYRRCLKRIRNADEKLLKCLQAETLLRAGFEINPAGFNLTSGDSWGVSRGRQEIAQQAAEMEPQMRAFEDLLQRRLISGLLLLLDPQVATKFEDAELKKQEVERLVPALSKLQQLFPELNQLRGIVHECTTLCSVTQDNQLQTAGLYQALERNAERLYDQLRTLKNRLASIPFPFDHGKGKINLDQYALEQIPYGVEKFGEMLSTGSEALDRLYPLFFRILSRLTALAEHIEERIGLQPLPDPEEETRPED